MTTDSGQDFNSDVSSKAQTECPDHAHFCTSATRRPSDPIGLNSHGPLARRKARSKDIPAVSTKREAKTATRLCPMTTFSVCQGWKRMHGESKRRDFRSHHPKYGRGRRKTTSTIVDKRIQALGTVRYRRDGTGVRGWTSA